MTRGIEFNLKPLTLHDLPETGSPEFAAFLDAYFESGLRIAQSIPEWPEHSTREGGVRIATLSKGSKICKALDLNDYWCGRTSTHTPASLEAYISAANNSASHHPLGPHGSSGLSLVRTLSAKYRDATDHERPGPDPTGKHIPTGDLSDQERQARVMQSIPKGIYEQFRRGLLEYHSENEREYIENCRESQCLDVLVPHVAEVWRLTYETPPPTSPRSFVVLLLSRELTSAPRGSRSFMNISLPFDHPECPEKQGSEKSRVRGKYVSVELVQELDDNKVQWSMATSSDAGGSIPRFITNGALPKSIAEDVPSFLKWMVKKYPSEEAGETANGAEAEA